MRHGLRFFQNLLAPLSHLSLLDLADSCIEDFNWLYFKTREVDAQSNCEAIKNFRCRPLINVSMQKYSNTTYFFLF